MSVKTTGAEFKKFYADPKYWGAEQWHDDEAMSVNGVPCDDGIDPDKLADDAVVSFEGGIVFMDQSTRPVEGPSFEAYFKRWKKEQTMTSVVVELPIDQLEHFKALIKASKGYKIL